MALQELAHEGNDDEIVKAPRHNPTIEKILKGLPPEEKAGVVEQIIALIAFKENPPQPPMSEPYIFHSLMSEAEFAHMGALACYTTAQLQKLQSELEAP